VDGLAAILLAGAQTSGALLLGGEIPGAPVIGGFVSRGRYGDRLVVVR
jgi:selenide, water dikinase